MGGNSLENIGTTGDERVPGLMDLEVKYFIPEAIGARKFELSRDDWLNIHSFEISHFCGCAPLRHPWTAAHNEHRRRIDSVPNKGSSPGVLRRATVEQPACAGERMVNEPVN